METFKIHQRRNKRHKFLNNNNNNNNNRALPLYCDQLLTKHPSYT